MGSAHNVWYVNNHLICWHKTASQHIDIADKDVHIYKIYRIIQVLVLSFILINLKSHWFMRIQALELSCIPVYCILHMYVTLTALCTLGKEILCKNEVFSKLESQLLKANIVQFGSMSSYSKYLNLPRTPSVTAK